MKVKSIDLGEDEMPTGATVHLTLEELTLICSLMGKISPKTMRDSYGDEYIPAQSELYEGTTNIFNRFYEDGVNDVVPWGKRVLLTLMRTDVKTQLEELDEYLKLHGIKS
jgi:hypothetical protein